MKISKFFTVAILGASVVLSSCSRNMDSSSYVDSAASGVVVEGVIVSARPVTIRGSDKLQDNAMGGLAGGVGGAAVGSTIGGGSGNTVATVGGAIAGAVIGAAVQQELGNSDGMEYIVKIARNNVGSTYDSKKRNDIKINDKSTPSAANVETNMKSELISVIQGRDIVFAAGTPVYVIYSDDRPRLIAR